MRTMEDNLEESKRKQVWGTCNEISRKCSFLHVFPEELTDEEVHMLKNVNNKLDFVFKNVYRRMHTGSEKE